MGQAHSLPCGRPIAGFHNIHHVPQLTVWPAGFQQGVDVHGSGLTVVGFQAGPVSSYGTFQNPILTTALDERPGTPGMFAGKPT